MPLDVKTPAPRGNPRAGAISNDFGLDNQISIPEDPDACFYSTSPESCNIARRPPPTLHRVEGDVLDDAERRDATADLHFRRQVLHLHALGPRATAELLEEIGARRMIRTVIDQELKRFAAIDGEALYVAGGDRIPRAPLHEVRL